MPQTVFKRYEIKYMLTEEQKQQLILTMQPYMRPDAYGHSSIRNIYYDTDTYRLIRRSIEKPVYKEKLRLRSYGRVDEGDTVFVELKKKYQSVVYKRRLALPDGAAEKWLSGGIYTGKRTQISGEIAYFLKFYASLSPAMFLSYERDAFYAGDGSDFRLTFDGNILARCERLSLREEVGGVPLLDRGKTLLEVKTPFGMPLWLTQFLTKNGIYKTSFSKYGEAYRRIILNRKGEEYRVG